ncbi:MAG TPA: retroviral-like aspartic protease family protein [Methylomirabilota bacterium]|nr:retroviral-like aspartic protease family protein [Methylomirabilota bacterium]
MRRAGGRLLLLLPLVALLGAGPGDLNETGKAAYQRGEYAEAERLFSQALARTPSDPLLHYHRGAALTKLGRLQEATAAYERALRLDPPPTVAAAAREGLRAIGALGAPPRPRRAEETVIALTKVPGGWLTEVVINGAWTGPLLLDTGASVTLISPAVARSAGLSIGSDTPVVEVQGIAGRTRGPIVTLTSLQVGEIEARGTRAVVVELPAGLHGLLGNSFLARYMFTLDPREGALRLQPR